MTNTPQSGQAGADNEMITTIQNIILDWEGSAGREGPMRPLTAELIAEEIWALLQTKISATYQEQH